MLIVGLTGGVGSGKSTVLRLFKKQGSRVLDVDNIVRKIVKSGTEVYNEIKKVFGNKCSNKDGVLDRRKLGNIVFSNDQARKRLNRITHPVIIERLRQIISISKHKKGIFVIEVPLLFEVHIENMFDRIVLCYLPLREQISRLREERDISRQKAVMMIRSQEPLFSKKKKSDFVIDTRYSLKNVSKQVENVCRIFKKRDAGL